MIWTSLRRGGEGRGRGEKKMGILRPCPRLPARLPFPRSRPTSLSPLEIREVRSRCDLDRFVKLPWRIYAEDPHWVPPLLYEVKEFLDRRKHPFYKHGDATQFIAMRGGETVGRVLASDDAVYNQEHRATSAASACSSRRQPGGGPCPVGRRRGLASRARPHGHPRADRLFDQLSGPACWSKVSTRRRGS